MVISLFPEIAIGSLGCAALGIAIDIAGHLFSHSNKYLIYQTSGIAKKPM